LHAALILSYVRSANVSRSNWAREQVEVVGLGEKSGDMGGGFGCGAVAEFLPPILGKVKTIEVHHLAPRRHELRHEFRLRVVTCVDLREGPELGVRTEDKDFINLLV
jgi:hypothetical protein